MRATLASATRSGLVALVALLSLGFDSPAASPRHVGIPLRCSQGPGGQQHDVAITVPAHVARGSRYTVRVDGVDSGKIAHVGLRYIFDMGSEWPIPEGTQYVEGSAHIVPGTGSENVRDGARLARGGGGLDLILPARVSSGDRYTPPSFEFELEVVSPEGASITQRFSGYRMTANAFLLGDVHMQCEPSPKAFPVAVTRVEAGS
jgi:hypothetical protein